MTKLPPSRLDDRVKASDLSFSASATFAGEPRLFRLNCRSSNQFAILVPVSRRTTAHETDIERKSLPRRSLFLQRNGVNTVASSSLDRSHAELAGFERPTVRFP
jgi:hypothetical protein